MLYAKPQLLTDSFHYPKRGTKKKQKSAAGAKPSRKPKAPKDPKPKRVPLTPEAKKERKRTAFKRWLEGIKALGLCRDCHEPAIGGQTRCQRCAEQHRVRRREDDRRRRTAAKLSAETLTQEPVAPASPEVTTPQADQQAERQRAKAASEADTPTHHAEDECLRGQHPEGKKTQGEYEKERRERLKASGLCRDCREQAIPNQTRCEACAEKHRVARRKNDTARREKKAASDHAGGGTR